MTELSAQLEALLFIYGEPMAVAKISQTLGIKAEQVTGAAKELGEFLISSKSGLVLMVKGDAYLLATRPEFSSLLEKVLKAELNESLTPAALETLSIIAYAGPIGRAEIDYIRGVNSSYTLRALSVRGLIDKENDPKRGNAYVYTPSFDFLKHVGVASAEALPEYQKFRELALSIKNPPNEQPKNS
jgi:segregation and condensation protein B